MTQLSWRLAATAIAAATLLSSAPALADEASYLQRFGGAWTGGGMVQRKATEDPHHVTCSMTGAPSQNSVSISGTCRAALVFTRQIRADIRFDPATGRYSGTYIGARGGPARLLGKRSGDAVVLGITWPKPLNGDRSATMTIQNAGGGKLRISVADKLGPQGPTAQVTNLALAQN
jgi:hypothetical protein